MEAYKFEATVQTNGVIKIPEIAKWANQQIEVFVIIPSPPPAQTVAKRQILQQFLDKWLGFLEGVDPVQLKTQYLQEKYS